MRGKRAERLQVMLTLDEACRVETWRQENGLPSRSSAVRALLTVGLQLQEAASEPAGENRGENPGETPGGNPGAAVLVLASEPLAGEGIRRVLETAGYRVVGPTGDADAAEALASAHRVAAAVLDGGADALPRLADRLAERDVPFLIVAPDGPVDAAGALPRRHRAVPLIDRANACRALAPALATLLD